MKLFHMHIPKNGGGTVNNWIAANHGDGFYHFGAHPDARELVLQQGCEVAGGHVAATVLDRLPGDPLCITTLRHPVDRVCSMYHWTRTRGPFADVNGMHNPYAGMSFAEFVDGLPYPRLGVCDQQTRMLSTDRLWPGGAKPDPVIARETLRQFMWTAIPDYMDEFFDNIACDMGWEHKGENVHVTGPELGAIYDIPDGLRQQIVDKNPLDMELWELTDEGARAWISS